MGDCVMRIPVRHRREVVAFALVDAEQYEALSKYTWHLRSGYAARCTRKGRNGVYAHLSFFMHREVLGLGMYKQDPVEVDHINRDPLDNRAANLRACTRRENKQNLSDAGYRGSTSRYRGVSWDTRRGRWVSSIKIDGKRKHLGYFTDEGEAAKVAADARAVHHPFSADARRREAA